MRALKELGDVLGGVLLLTGAPRHEGHLLCPHFFYYYYYYYYYYDCYSY